MAAPVSRACITTGRVIQRRLYRIIGELGCLRRLAIFHAGCSNGAFRLKFAPACSPRHDAPRAFSTVWPASSFRQTKSVPAGGEETRPIVLNRVHDPPPGHDAKGEKADNCHRGTCSVHLRRSRRNPSHRR